MAARRDTSADENRYLGEFEQLVLFAVLRLEEASGIAIHDEIEGRTGRDVATNACHAARLGLRRGGPALSWAVRRKGAAA